MTNSCNANLTYTWSNLENGQKEWPGFTWICSRHKRSTNSSCLGELINKRAAASTEEHGLPTQSRSFFVGWVMCAGLWVRVVEEEESGERLHPSHGIAPHSVWVTRGRCYGTDCRQQWVTNLLKHRSGTDYSQKTRFLVLLPSTPLVWSFRPTSLHALRAMLCLSSWQQQICSTESWETDYASGVCHRNNSLNETGLCSSMNLCFKSKPSKKKIPVWNCYKMDLAYALPKAPIYGQISCHGRITSKTPTLQYTICKLNQEKPQLLFIC